MTNQFVHVGDVHLQSTNARNAAKLRALDQIIDEGLQLPHLAAWLIPGDLFESRSSTADRNDLAARLTRMADAAIVLITPGNHDLPGELDIYSKLKARWPVHVQTTPAVLSIPLATGDTAALAVLPYRTRAGLVSQGFANADVVQTAGDLLDVLFMQFAAELAPQIAAGKIPLFMGHVNVAGSISSSGQPQVGMEIEIDRAMLQRLPTVYNALSHIHLPQAVGAGVYAGSIAPMSFGEIEHKFYNVVTCDQQADGTWTGSYAQRRIDTPALYHVEGTLDREQFVWTVKAGPGGDAQPAPASWAGTEVRVRYSFQQSEKSALPTELVRAPFAEAARLEVEPIAVPDRALRAPAVAAARTLADKVAAVCQVEALAPSVAAKLSRLEHVEAAQVLAEVQAALDAPAPTELVAV